MILSIKISEKFIWIWTKFLDFWKIKISKYPLKNLLNFVQLAAPKIVKTFVRFLRKIGEFQFWGLFWEFVNRANFLTKKSEYFGTASLTKFWGFFSRNFDRNTFSKNLRNFQKSKNLVKIPRNCLENFVGRTKPRFNC